MRAWRMSGVDKLPVDRWHGCIALHFCVYPGLKI